jgi:hypothetical protein
MSAPSPLTSILFQVEDIAAVDTVNNGMKTL